MTFKVGDKVRVIVEDAEVPKGTVGKVDYVWAGEEFLPYEVEVTYTKKVTVIREFNLTDLALVPTPWQRFTNWLNRTFPKRDAEEHFGSEETVKALKAVHDNGVRVDIQGN